ncbi:MAG: 30S ribosomal protein S8 [Malacoplasma sp.]|nr:30S ribosomal protein S8 [Malacoplasma sp.]
MYMDPISDLFLRIKNGTKIKKSHVIVRTSKLTLNILEILKNEGYIINYKIESIGKNKTQTVVYLKYKNNISSISGLKQISKPGLRIYSEAKKIPKVLNGLGIAIISTNMGLMTDKNAKINNVGGEVIAYVW